MTLENLNELRISREKGIDVDDDEEEKRIDQNLEDPALFLTQEPENYSLEHTFDHVKVRILSNSEFPIDWATRTVKYEGDETFKEKFKRKISFKKK